MTQTDEQRRAVLMQVSDAMVSLHKEQFGRGPSNARAYYAGPDVLICILDGVLLPAELKMVAIGDTGRVRDARTAFQAATADEFIQTIEQILGRQVRAFASSVDPAHNTVFENFAFEPAAASPAAG